MIDLAEHAMATSVNHIDVGSDGVKDVRIGTDDQASPTTRVVVDLYRKCRYEILPATDGKFMVKSAFRVRPSRRQSILSPRTAPSR